MSTTSAPYYYPIPINKEILDLLDSLLLDYNSRPTVIKLLEDLKESIISLFIKEALLSKLSF